jgi:hypothetical protein
MNSSENSNGFVKKWQVVLLTISVAITIVSLLIHEAVVNAQTEQRVTSMEHHIDYDDTVFERRDVVEQRLQYIEETEHRIEELQKAQNAELQTILMQSRRP